MPGKPGDKEGLRSNHEPPNPQEVSTKKTDEVTGKETAGEKSKDEKSKEINPSRYSDLQIQISQSKTNQQGVSEISSSPKEPTSVKAHKALNLDPAHGDVQPSKIRRGTNKRRHALNQSGQPLSIQDEIFATKSTEEQFVIVVNNLSDGLERHCMSQSKKLRN